MPLTNEQRVRYARHLLLPELAEAGQLRLLAGRVRFADGAEEGAREVASGYLRRAGVRIEGEREDADAHAHAHAHVDVNVNVNVNVNVDVSGDGDVLSLTVPSLLCQPSLSDVAQGLAGAFAAVEAIKALAGMGEPAQLHPTLLLAEEV